MQIPIRLKAACICAGGLCSLMVLSSAWADNCDKINSNSAWKDGFEQMNAAYKAEDWKAALKHAKELEEICDLSPNLNYTIARIHKNRGDKEKYLYYLQKSTQNTERFAVDKDTLDRMWSEKYIAAHPEADPENIEALNKKIDDLNSEIATLKGDLDQADLSAKEVARTTITKEEHLEVQINDYRTPMWIATGIGIGGLAMAGAGAGLVAYKKNESVDFSDSKIKVPGTYKVNASYVAGWILVGVGSGLAIGGAVFSGIFGYKYKHFKDTQSWSLNISPNYTSVSFEF
ncbi:MAG: hypothetical protein J6A01_04060 [Proteobacteria bacterium]|nr:hypothetical protein [Pseudomonadota bacterium]